MDEIQRKEMLERHLNYVFMKYGKGYLVEFIQQNQLKIEAFLAGIEHDFMNNFLQELRNSERGEHDIVLRLRNNGA